MLLKIDELVISDHPLIYLSADDCYYYMEYTARQGFAYSAANSLIHNFKKSVERRHLEEYKHKEQAIHRIANLFKETLALNEAGWTNVPIPPSKTKSNPLYDDRMSQCLMRFCPENFNELLILNKDMTTAHESESRPSVNNIIENLSVDKLLRRKATDHIALFDDVLTTGAHFRAAKEVLESHFPSAYIIGIFVARRALSEKT